MVHFFLEFSWSRSGVAQLAGQANITVRAHLYNAFSVEEEQKNVLVFHGLLFPSFRQGIFFCEESLITALIFSKSVEKPFFYVC